MHRRQVLMALPSLAALAALPRLALAGAPRQAVIGAAWRGPGQSDPYRAGALVADWESRKIGVRYAVPLPGRAHDVLAEPDGGLLVVAYRFGDWLLRCDDQGGIVRQVSLADEGERRCCGHATYAPDRSALYTTETDLRTGRGWISMRDPASLKKVGEWETHGVDPHQVLTDHDGSLLVANGGVPRRPADDKKLDLSGMDSSLVRLDGRNGQLLGQWRLDDGHLSIRHIAWSRPPAEAGRLLGIALQAEHGEAARRAVAATLAVFDGTRLVLPTQAGDGIGYCGNIAPAHRGGFVLTSTANKAFLWHPGVPDRFTPIVEMEGAYAVTPWAGSDRRGGAIIATAIGLVRWHPTDKPLILPWPSPMALDNHWELMNES